MLVIRLILEKEKIDILYLLEYKGNLELRKLLILILL